MEIVLLMCILTVSRSKVGVMHLPGKISLLPPMANLVLFGSSSFWSVAHHNTSVCDIFPEIGGDFVFVNEQYCVDALDLSRHALGKSPHSVAV